jgi:TolB protein
VNFSRDGQWLVYVAMPSGTLWISRVDGRDRKQLTTEYESFVPKFSPDGKQVVFSRVGGGLDKVWVVSVANGALEQLLPDAAPDVYNEGYGSWSADGNKIALCLTRKSLPGVIAVVEVASRKVRILPGSEGLDFSIWSPDGRYIAGSPSPGRDGGSAKVLDLKSGSWSELPVQGVWSWGWSPDSRYIYLMRLRSTQLERINVDTRRVEAVAELGENVRLVSVGPDGSPVVQREVATSEIYALELEYR